MTTSAVQRLIKYALVLGALAMLAGFILPLLFTGRVKQERARLASCEREERIDCDPSVIWLLLK